MKLHAWLVVVVVVSGSMLVAWSADPVAKPRPPEIAKASDEGERALSQFRKPEGFTVDLAAAEPLLANPVAFCFDEKSRIYVCETYRQSKGVEDNRGHMSWLDDDLAAQTVADRLAYFKKHLGDKVQEYTREDDRIRLLEDKDGDGKYESSTVFAEGFNDIVEGTGAGVLARRGEVFYTCIPNLWLLKDTDGDGHADVRESLQYGYGVRVAFRGHDSHGLRMGPDGRIYFSIGDRGYHIEYQGKVLARPDTGAVFRCQPDGSDFEVFAYGLRNPQELAFDDFGNLFTGDNNSDSGDKARWVNVVQGADIGWRMYYQYLNDRGPWNREKLWHPYHAGQPAYITPPIVNLADGPSGLTYYPGQGLSDRYRGHFFLADFRGGPGNSGIRSFAVKPKGATFELVDSHEFIWQILATDVEFGYDGGLYVSDWVNGWNGEGKGRIYRFADPQYGQTPEVQQVKEIMAAGFTQRPADELAALLKHIDQRVRLESQFALADRGAESAPVFEQALQQTDVRLARLHGLWGLGQIGRKDPARLAPAVAALADGDSEVRAQAAKVLGEVQVPEAFDKLVAALQDEETRVRFFAAQSLARYENAAAVRPLLTVLEANADVDPALRHGCVMGLVGSSAGDLKPLLAAIHDGNASVRLGVTLALRRLKRPELAQLLQDTDQRVVDEAIRAIHDEPLYDLFPALAGLADRSQLSDESWRRIINANFRLGAAPNAEAVASIAARPQLSDAVRINALQALGDWAQPSSRDRVLGDWRPLSARSGDVSSEALQTHLGGIFQGSDAVRKVAAEVAAKLGVKQVGPVLVALARDAGQPADGRIAALQALVSLQDSQVGEVVEESLKDKTPAVRAAAQRLWSLSHAEEAVPLLAERLEKGTIIEQQTALATLADLKSSAADALLLQELRKLVVGNVAPEVALDILDANTQRKSDETQRLLDQYEAGRPKNVPWAAFQEALSGGDAGRGRTIFYERAQVSCVRCHKIGGLGGDVGPDLSKVGTEKKRDYLLESIVTPSQQIAKGFETAVIVTNDGKSVTGIVKQEDDQSITILNADARLITIPKDEIDERVAGKSSMPDGMTQYLSKRDLRDLVEFLAHCRGQ